MAGFDNDICYANNVDFSGGSPVAGKVTTDGQLLIGSTASPNIRVATLTAGTGINIVNGAGAITINAAGGGLTWSRISGSGSLAINNGYIAVSPGGALTLSLPATSNTGDVVELVLNGATSWQITQGAGQQVRVGNVTTTLGAGGSITSTAQGDGIRLVCDTANTLWIATPSPIGSLTIV